MRDASEPTLPLPGVPAEVRLHSQLRHPHILRLHAVFEDDSYVFLVTEFAEVWGKQGGRRWQVGACWLPVRCVGGSWWGGKPAHTPHPCAITPCPAILLARCRAATCMSTSSARAGSWARRRWRARCCRPSWLPWPTCTRAPSSTETSRRGGGVRGCLWMHALGECLLQGLLQGLLPQWLPEELLTPACPPPGPALPCLPAAAREHPAGRGSGGQGACAPWEGSSREEGRREGGRASGRASPWLCALSWKPTSCLPPPALHPPIHRWPTLACPSTGRRSGR